MPVIAIWGSRDTWVPPVDLDRLSAIRPDITARVIGGAAHCPMETHPNEFAAIVLEWLSGIRSALVITTLNISQPNVG